jgi:hypothetical protein
MVIIKCPHQHQYKSSTTTLPTTLTPAPPSFPDPPKSTMIEDIDEIDLNDSDTDTDTLLDGISQSGIYYAICMQSSDRY